MYLPELCCSPKQTIYSSDRLTVCVFASSFTMLALLGMRARQSWRLHRGMQLQMMSCRSPPANNPMFSICTLIGVVRAGPSFTHSRSTGWQCQHGPDAAGAGGKHRYSVTFSWRVAAATPLSNAQLLSYCLIHDAQPLLQSFSCGVAERCTFEWIADDCVQCAEIF